jgi:hypothetical protein
LQPTEDSKGRSDSESASDSEAETELPAAPWHLSPAQQNWFDDQLVAIKLPNGALCVIFVVFPDVLLVGYGGRMKRAFRHTGWLKAHHWRLLASPLGVYLLQQVQFPDKYKDPILDLFLWLNDCCVKVLYRDELDELRLKGHQVLARLELLFPLYSCTIVRHLANHLCDTLELCGPVSAHWM